MLGYWDDAGGARPRRSTRPAGCTPATWRRWTTTATCNIVGRIKDMVIRGGENVYPREVEEFLYTPPGRSPTCRSSACPTSATARSCAPGSCCARARRSTPTACASSADGQIAHFKIPRYVRFVDEFPMTVTGKVQKYRMREQEIEALGPAEPSQAPKRPDARPIACLADNRTLFASFVTRCDGSGTHRATGVRFLVGRRRRKFAAWQPICADARVWFGVWGVAWDARAFRDRFRVPRGARGVTAGARNRAGLRRRATIAIR